MFFIPSLWLHNFKSFRGKHKIEFAAEPGLYFLTGKNLDEPALGSNGAGKSTILDAIYWCLEGRTLRGLKAGDVITRGETTCSVTMDLIIKDRDVRVKRTQSPNSLTATIDGVESVVEQEGLRKLIGLSPAAITRSVIIPQFTVPFFDLLPSQKLTLFSEIMDLDFWLQRSKEADDAAAALEQDLGKLKTEVASKRGRLELLNEDAASLKKQSVNFEAAQRDELDKMWGRHTSIEANKARYEKELIAADKLIGQRKKQLVASQEALSKQATQRQALFTEKQGAAGVVVVKQAKCDDLAASGAALGALGAKCDTCGQPINKTHVQAQQNALAGQFKAAVAALKQAKAALAEVDADLAINATASNVITEEVNERVASLEEAEDEMAATQQALNGCLRDLANLEPQLKGNTFNPYQAQLEQKLAAIKTVETDVLLCTGQITKIEVEWDSTKYWVGGFKRIRLYLIEETLRTLEIEVNNSLVSLGLQEWRIEFDIERENKSGGLTKGFVVLIYVPGHDKPIRWEAFSGGEIQRLRLAGDFGLSNLIMTQAGFVNHIEFYDEPSQHLSPEGLLSMAETLSARALDGGKSIWLVDHHTIEFGEFTDTMTVIKDGGSSHFA